MRAGKIDIIVVYKVDRLTRSLADFAKLVELFDEHGVSFVSVTQQFNTTTSMGRLTLNVLLSFAQFEREVTSERIRDKIAASKRKGSGSACRPRRRPRHGREGRHDLAEAVLAGGTGHRAVRARFGGLGAIAAPKADALARVSATWLYSYAATTWFDLSLTAGCCFDLHDQDTAHCWRLWCFLSGPTSWHGC